MKADLAAPGPHHVAKILDRAPYLTSNLRKIIELPGHSHVGPH